jgi:putative RNA 2'-phosphotransferase
LTNKRSISRLLSLMLRHRPDEFGLVIDEYGYVPFAQVAQAVQERYEEVTQEDILDLLRAPDQRRFELTDRGIRALYGHSFFVEMDGAPMTPPERLYMGTTVAAARRFAAEGIGPGDRFYVHLSRDHETAAERSREESGPVVVEILAPAAAAAGIEFYERGAVVLTRNVPAAFVGQIQGLPARPPAGGAGREPVRQSVRPAGGVAVAEPVRPAAQAAGPTSYGRRPRGATRR